MSATELILIISKIGSESNDLLRKQYEDKIYDFFTNQKGVWNIIYESLIKV